MGREARGHTTVDGASVPVSLHLDSRTLQVRGGLRRDIAREDVVTASAEGTTLTVRAGDADLVVDLDVPAARWAAAIMATPPTLRAKLGLEGDVRAYVLGDPPAEVAAALDQGTTPDPRTADLVVATVGSPADLDALPATLERLGVAGPVWVVHGKGRAAAPGEGPVRTVMRAAGYRDTKVSAVSDAWSATRYSP